MILNILGLCDGERILAGAQGGKDLFAKLVAATPSQTEPQPVFLDFSGIVVATSSFLRDSVITFRDYARTSAPTLYPVIGNADEGVLEELFFFLHHRGDAIFACDVTPNEEISDVRIIGRLDDVQRTTLSAVTRLKSASAPALASLQTSEPPIGATGWNNRLKNLAGRGLLVERRFGKTKNYSPVLEIADGG